MKRISKAAEELLAGVNNQSSITIFKCNGEQDSKVMFLKTEAEFQVPRIIFEIDIDDKGDDQGDDEIINGKIIEISLIDTDGETSQAHLSKWHLNAKVMISFKEKGGGTMIR